MDKVAIVLGAMVIAALIALAARGSIYLASDFRHFNTLVKQCETQGYIQDHKTRILCEVEKK